MNADKVKEDKYLWAGPLLFTSVLIALIALFWWFL